MSLTNPNNFNIENHSRFLYGIFIVANYVKIEKNSCST